MRGKTRFFFGFGVVAVLGMMACITTYALHRMTIAQAEVAAVIENSGSKLSVAEKLRHTLDERGRTLQRMLDTRDDLEHVELQSQLIYLTSDYLVARDYIALSDLQSDERGLRSGISAGLADVKSRFDRLIATERSGARSGELRQQLQALNQARRKVLSLIDDFMRLQREHSGQALSRNGAIHDRARNAVVVGSIVCLLLALSASQYVLWRTARRTRKLAYQASHDPLTRLINRAEFEKRVEHALGSAKRYGHEHTLILFDLDRFKIVNDSAGHLAGDHLLKTLARTLQSMMRQRDSLGRIGGDEFGVLLDNCPLTKALDKAREIIARIESLGFVWKGDRFDISASLGVTLLCVNDTSGSAINRADAACYRAKQRGAGKFEVAESGRLCPLYSECNSHELPASLSLLREERYELYYQPICRSDYDGDRPVRYAEILIRSRDESGNILLPGTFIPDAERYGLIQNIDRWVVQNTLQWLSEKRPTRSALKLSINLSGRSICDEKMADFILGQFEKTGVDPRAIVFEVTETAAISGLKRAIGNMEKLNAIGCAFSLDDFGSGLSSFTYLKNLPIDFLKIDGEFVRNIHADRKNCSIVRLFNDIGHTFGKHTVAEFVEDEQTRHVLRDIGVDFLQGNVIGVPRALRGFGFDDRPSNAA